MMIDLPVNAVLAGTLLLTLLSIIVLKHIDIRG